MKKSNLKEVFDKIMKAYPNMDSLVCYTEAVFITNPSPKEIKRGFYRYVEKSDYGDFTRKEIIRDTFGDMLDGKKSALEERLSRSLWN